MKNKFLLGIIGTFLIVLLGSNSLAQIPQGVNYQAVLRNASGTIMQNKNVTMKFTIHKATPNGSTVYEETWQTTTNGYGLVNLQIGLGSPIVGSFSSVKWGTNSFYLQVNADIGAGYVNLGTTQFISVPYALVADTVLHGGGGGDNWGSQTVVSNSTITGGGTSGSPLTLAQQGATSGQTLKWNGTTWSPGNDLTGSSGVTSITAGTGLSGGTITTSGTISAQNATALWNANQLQGIGLSSSTPTAGQVLQYNGTSWAPATTSGVIIINSSNYTSTNVSADNYVAIQGTISLAANYNGLSGKHLVINGGTITGNGSYVLSIGSNCVFNGVTFNAVDIDCNWATFINCIFSGNCARLGYDSKFNNCQFSGVTTGSTYLLGSIVNSSVSNCSLPRCNEFVHSNITTSTIGNGSVNQCAISNISGCFLSSCSIYALQSDFIFTGNRCSNTSIFLNNSTQVCSQATITNNQFRSGLTSTTAPINIDPTTSGYKIYNIQDNHFGMQSGDDYCIKFTSSTNGATYTNVSIKGNTFWRGANTYPILYQSNITVDYTGNTAWQLSNPSSSGNLTVSSPNFTH